MNLRTLTVCASAEWLSRAYAACPVCSPSRASFLTGKYTATVGVTNWIANPGGTPAAIIMKGYFKLIEFFEDNHTELYDLESDPSELHDLTKEMPEKSTEMLTLLHDWQKSVNAKMPERNPDYIPW